MKKPNIIFILIDDMGWKDLSCYGSGFYETPNIDRLAKEGMQFSDAYAACPVCSPTRASIMSGKYPARVGVTDWISHTDHHPLRGKLIDAPYTKYLPLEEKSVASALRGGGYSTWHVGKWHLGKSEYYPEKHGFDKNIGGCSWGAPRNGYFSPWGIETLEDGKDGEYLTDKLTDKAIELIENRGEKPFFMNLCYYAVHCPIQAKPEYIEKYRKKAEALGLDKLKTFEEGEFFHTEDKKGKRVKRRLLQSDPAYAAMIQSLDENVGRLLDSLDRLGIADDTAIFFTSDNGGLATAEGSPTCNSPLNEGKGWMYEGGTREPLLARWPGKIKPGSTCDASVTSPDFYPTFLEMAGMEPMPEQHVDGESIMPLLQQTGNLKRKAIFWHYPHYGNQGGTPGSSLRSGDYKLIEFYENETYELYNLREDISETHNLADKMPDKTKELKTLLEAWKKEVNALIPRQNLDK